MPEVSIFDTTCSQPTVIQTVRNEVIVIRDLPAPGPQGLTGTIYLAIDGGGPGALVSPAHIDGGIP